MNAFIDTNVSIAYVFLIDPLNKPSSSVFRNYENIFFSELVKLEFDDVFYKKLEILIKFFKKIRRDLKKGKLVEITLNNLKRYAKDENYTKKELKHIINSLTIFWDKYVNERFPNANSFKIAIDKCLKDLKILTYSRKTYLENFLKITEKRTKKYSNLKNKLKENSLHYPDYEIILDAHDHNLKNSYDLDFITFDKDCCKGAKLSDFSFNKVKYKWDFTF